MRRLRECSAATSSSTMSAVDDYGELTKPVAFSWYLLVPNHDGDKHWLRFSMGCSPRGTHSDTTTCASHFINYIVMYLEICINIHYEVQCGGARREATRSSTRRAACTSSPVSSECSYSIIGCHIILVAPPVSIRHEPLKDYLFAPLERKLHHEEPHKWHSDPD